MADIPVNANDRLFIALVTLTGQTVFDFDFLLLDGGDMRATYEDPDGGRFEIPEGNFTVSGVGVATGGTLTLVGYPVAASGKIIMHSEVVISRLSDYQKSGDFRASVINAELDKMTIIEQELRRDIDRAALSPMGADGLSIYPGEAGQLLQYDGIGNIIPATGDGDGGSALAQVFVSTFGPRTGTTTANLATLDKGPLSPRRFGATGAGDRDDMKAIFDCMEVAGASKRGVMIDGKFRSYYPGTIPAGASVSFFGYGRECQLRFDTDNTSPGLSIVGSDVSFYNFDLQSYSETDLTNGTGHNGTCFTMGEAFPNRPLVKVSNVKVIDMILSRAAGSETGHAFAMVGRARGLRVLNTIFEGADDAFHGNAALLHWSGDTPGVSVVSIFYDGMTTPFAAGNLVQGQLSGAVASIVKVQDLGGGTGRLGIKEVDGEFLDNEILFSIAGGSARADGRTWVNSIDYDAGSGTFIVGDLIVGTGGTPPTGRVAKNVITGVGTGTLYFWNGASVGAFVDNMALTGPSGTATAAGARINPGLVQSPFLPGQHTYHPNDFKMLNCSSRNTSRIAAISSSYNVQIHGFSGDDTLAQFIDLPVGDEAGTFAAPEDYGMVYSGYSFKDLHAPLVLGSGSNSVTVLDVSGVSTSKQLDSDLAFYADASYAGMAYNKAQERFRMVEFRSCYYGNMIWEAGLAGGTTPYVRQIWVRNTFGSFMFENLDIDGRDGVLSMTVDNFRGNMEINGCNMYGGLAILRSDQVLIDGTKVAQPVATDDNLYVFGDVIAATTNAAGFVLGAKSFTLSAPLNQRFVTGTPIRGPGFTVYTTEWFESGSTIVRCSEIPVGAAGAQAVEFDRSTRLHMDMPRLTRGKRGIHVEGPALVTADDALIQQTGDIGVTAETGGVLILTRPTFQGNGQNNYADPGTGTRNIIIATGGTIHTDRATFRDSKAIDYHFVASTGWVDGSLTNSTFEDAALTAYTSVAANANTALEWHGNKTGAGVRLPPLAWTPELRVGGVALADQTSLGTYEINGDEITLWFNITVNAVAALTGTLTVGGNPCPAAGAGHEGIGVMNIQNGLTISTTPFPRIGAGATAFAFNRQGSTSYTTLDHTNIQAGTVFKGYVKYRIN